MPLTIQNIIANNARGFFYGDSVSYLVDDYSPRIAYSTQQISSTITNVIRLRRSSDNAESDFSATDLTDGTALTWSGTTSNVVKWYNQGTGGATYDIVQTTASAQPVFVVGSAVSTLNGVPTVNMSGSTKFMIVNDTNDYVSNGISVFSVLAKSGTETVGCALSLSNTSTQTFSVFRDARTTAPFSSNVTNTSATSYLCYLSTPYTTSQELVLQSDFHNSSKNMSSFDNGATGGTDTFTGTYNQGKIQLGRRGISSNPLEGYISEIIIFNTDELTNRTAIETNINDRFTIY